MRYSIALALFLSPIAIGWLGGMEIARHAHMAITVALGAMMATVYLSVTRPLKRGRAQ